MRLIWLLNSRVESNIPQKFRLKDRVQASIPAAYGFLVTLGAHRQPLNKSCSFTSDVGEKESIECLCDVIVEAGQPHRGQPRPRQRHRLSGQKRIQDVVEVKFAAGRKKLEVELKRGRQRIDQKISFGAKRVNLFDASIFLM